MKFLGLSIGAILGLLPLAAPPTAISDSSSAQLLVKGDYESPKFSPDGEHLLLVSEKMKKLTLFSFSSGTSRTLANESGVGVNARFLPDGRVAFDAKRAGKVRVLVRTTEGEAGETTTPNSLAFAHKGRIYLRGTSGSVLISTGDTFFAPIESPDKGMIAFSGLASGLHVYSIKTGKTLRVGPGTYPSWSPDGKRLVYEWTVDDGHQIVGSDLWLWDTQSGSRPLTSSETITERHPSFSPDGKSVVFDNALGSIYKLNLGAIR